MGDKVTLTRPDGSQFEADEQDEEQYKALGYQRESTQANFNRNLSAAKEDHFTSPGQRTVAGLEGFVNGLTVGGYTSLIGGGENEQDRARYNPGTRMGGEIVGAILPSLLPGGAEAEGVRIAEMGGELLAHTPQGLLTRGAEAIAEGTTATKTAHGFVRGAVEGGVMGAGAAASNAKLNGDPITAEAVVAGMGWGALWGGGLGHVSAKLGVAGEKAAAEEATRLAEASRGAVPAEKWSAFRSSIEDVRKSAEKTIDDAAAHVAEGGGSFETSQQFGKHVLSHAEELEKEQGTLFNRVDVEGGWGRPGAKGLKTSILDTQKKIAKVLKTADYGKYEELANRQVTNIKALGDLAKVASPEVEPFLAKQLAESTSAMESLKGLRAVSESLKDIPFTSEGFVGMTPKKMEKVSAAVEKFIKDAPEELTPQKESMQKAIESLAADAGLTLDSKLSPAGQLRTIHETMRGATTKKAAEAAADISTHGFGQSTVKYVGGHAARSAAKDAGASALGKGLAARTGAHLVGGLLALKAGVMGTLLGGVQKWAVSPVGVKALKLVGPKIDPLAVRLDGSLEESKLPRKQLMMARMKEIREAAPTINDTLYRAVEPIVGSHPDLAVGLNKAAVAMFQALTTKMPRDPGLAFNRMKSLWAPDGIMTEKFARAYEVFQNPVGVALRFLQNPKSITPEGARALSEFNPELWQTLRVEMLNRLAEPGALDSMSYSEQVGLGQLLQIQIHSTQDPRFIKEQQLMFQKRNEPLPARPSASDNNSNNLSGTSRGMTASQRITEH